MLRICVWGDSITTGGSDIGGGWCDRLKRYYIAQADDVTVYNLGISGATTNDLLRRFEVEAQARSPDLVIFAIGVNDARYLGKPESPEVSLEDFEKNVRKLIAQAQNYTEKIVLVGLTPVDDSKTSPIPWDPQKLKTYKNVIVQKYDSCLKSIAQDLDISYVEVASCVELTDMNDGLHPGSQSHELMCEKVKEELSKIC